MYTIDTDYKLRLSEIEVYIASIKGDVYNALINMGFSPIDPRLSPIFKLIEKRRRTSTECTKELVAVMQSVWHIFAQILSGRISIPDWGTHHAKLTELFVRVSKEPPSGAVADYIP